MKNFTNNFKQFTSRLSARWLIMALMLLLGTSSAWGVDVYFENTLGWSSVHVYVSNNTLWNGDKGCTTNGATHYQMTNISGNLWKCSPSSTFNYIIFMKDEQNNYTNIWNTQASYRSDYSSSTPLFTPSTNSNQTTNGTTYYSVGEWSVLPVCVGDRYIAGTSNIFGSNWSPGDLNNKMLCDNITGYSKTYITNFNSDTEIEFKITDGSWDNSWGNNGGNYKHTVKNGCRSVTIKFNGITGEISVDEDASGACCTAPTSAPTLSKVSDIVKCGTTTITSGTLEIGTVNTGSTYYYKIGTNGTEQEITLNNKQFTVSSEGDYYVKEVNDCGASSSWSSKVTISETNNSVSISAITGPETICAGITDQEYSITEIPDVSYAWSVTGEGLSTNSSTSNSVLISAENKSSQVNGTLSVTVTKNGCETTIQQPKSITLIPLPTITTVDPTSGKACSSTTIADLEAGLTITKSDNSTTKWYKGGDEKSSTATVETGEYTIKAISNTGSCVSNSSVTYTVTGITTIPTGLTIDINGQTSASICEGTATINAKATGATSYSLYNENDELVETINGDANGVSFTVSETNTYKVKATNNCGSTEFSDDVTLTVNPVPSLTNFDDVTLCSSSTLISVEDLITETGATAGNSVTIKLYDENEVEITSPLDVNVNTQTNRTYKLKAFTQTCSSGFVSFTLTVNPLPAAPALANPSKSVCQANETVNLNTLAGVNDVIWYQGEYKVQNSDEISIDEEGTFTYTAKAVNGNGCQSATGVDFTLTVNPLPTINIGEDVTAVKFEDVVLTATGNNIDDVTWIADKGTITKDATDPKKAILTYDQTGEVEVTATATSAASCTSIAATKTVTFSAENCNDVVEYDNEHVEIWLSSSLNTTMYLHRWYENGNSDTDITSWPGARTTISDGYYKWTTTSSGNIGYIFHDNSATNKSSDANKTLEKGYRYYFTFNGGTGSATFNKSERITTTTPAPITTPAVKMLSAFSEEGSGELSMTAQIVKTGCNGNMTYYFKYRLKGAQAWRQTTTETATDLEAGDEINETVSGLDQGGTYEIQAVINNNNEAVSNIIEYEVNIEETAISGVTLQFADGEGSVYQDQNKIYCVGSTAYIKLSYDGTAHKSLEWIAENELQPVDDIDKLFSYVVRGNETITANVANDENEGTPATGTIDIKVYTIATTPDISIDKTEVCSTDQVGAKITVNAPQIGITYQAYKKVGDVETPHGDDVVAGNAESIVINSIKETGTYYVKAWNAACADNKKESLLKFEVTKIDASSNTIAISPVSASTNPWVPVTVVVDKNSAYDYTLVCKQGNTDVTDQMVINKKGDSYVIKFPKPESAEITDGQVVFDDITYHVVATLNGDVQCGTTSATSTVTLTELIEDCD